jgi:hypothetical protein
MDIALISIVAQAHVGPAAYDCCPDKYKTVMAPV